MLTSLIFLGLLFSSNALSQEFVDKVVEEIQEVGKNCAEKEGATADDLTELLTHKLPPSTHTAKCVQACFLEHYKVIKPDGTFDKQATIDAFRELKSEDGEIYAKVLKVIDICQEKPEIFEDKCETASAYGVCLKKVADELGLLGTIM